ncbi:MAG: response regulator [Planctomycetota bacterium]
MSGLQRILVCDDSLTIRRLVSMVASGLGLQVDLAVNAEDGVGKSRESRPDLLLLDYVLPDGKGTDVLDALHSNPDTRDIPVVMMSGKGEALREQLADRAAVVGFIHKPFKPKELEELLVSHQGQQPDASPAIKAPLEAAGAGSPSVVGEATGAGSLLTAMSGQPESLLGRLDDRAFAKILFKVFRGELSRLSESLAGGSEPVPDGGALAKRLIKPSVVRELRAEIEQACPPRRASATGLLEVAHTSVLERAPGFSSRIQGAPLREHERQLLGLVDGNRTVQDVGRELAWPAADMAKVLNSVASLGLIRMRTGLVGGTKPGTVWLVDEQIGDFANDLAVHLGRYGRRWTLVRLRSNEVAQEAQQATPDCVLVACSAPDVVAELRAVPQLERVPLAALFEEGLLTSNALLGAGADMALAVPVTTSAIDSFLGIPRST